MARTDLPGDGGGLRVALIRLGYNLGVRLSIRLTSGIVCLVRNTPNNQEDPMSIKSDMPKREAVVMVSRNMDDFVPCLDVDPIMIPVDCSGIADVFDFGLLVLMDSICTWEAEDVTADYRLVWSDTRKPVIGVCPMCDDFFEVAEGFPGDEEEDGYEAVICGCDPDE
jgi:hypothetical protein